MTTAATWSTTGRCLRPRTPASRSVRWAETVLSRSSTSRTGTGVTRRAMAVAYWRAATAAAPSSPRQRPGQADHDLDGVRLQDDPGDPVQVSSAGGVPAEGLHGSRDERRGVAAGDADAD